MTPLRETLVVLIITTWIGLGTTALASSSLQQMIDETPEHGELKPPPGIYYGSLLIDKPITIDGGSQVTVDAGGKGSVIVVKTDGATIQGLRLINSGESHNDIDAGVQLRGNFNVIKDNIIENSLFGIDLQQSENNIVRRNRISSKDLPLGQRGDAIRLWYSFDNKITDNDIHDSRDTVVWYSAKNVISRNTARDSRYSLHFMYSRYNLVEDNRYFNNTVGIFLMYSDGVVLKRNRIAHAAGPTGVGIGFKETSGVTVQDNEILYCASGLYIDVSPFQPDSINHFEGNLIAYNGIGIRFLNDWTGNKLIGNRFVDNLSQIVVSGGKTANRNLWSGNYWSDYQGFDEDSDRVGDSPYELYAYADRIWKDEPYAQFFKGSPVLEVLDFLERLAPFSEPDLLVRDTTPITSVEFLIPDSNSVTPAVVSETVRQSENKSSLDLLRESLGRQ